MGNLGLTHDLRLITVKKIPDFALQKFLNPDCPLGFAMTTDALFEIFLLRMRR
jgi:hypothetical protein